MGKWTEVAYEDEMVRKTKFLFNLVQDKMKKDTPDNTFSFENFVDSLDENDKFIRRLFEFLIKETLQRHRRSRSQSQPYPESIETSSQRFRSRLSTLPFQLTSNELGGSEVVDSPDGILDEQATNPGTGSGTNDRATLSLPSSFTEHVARRNSRLGNLPQELLELQQLSHSQSHQHHNSSAASRAAAHQQLMIDRRIALSRAGGAGSSRPIAHLYRSSSSSAARHREPGHTIPNQPMFLPLPEFAASRHSPRLSPRLSTVLAVAQADAAADHDGVLASDIPIPAQDHAVAQQQVAAAPAAFAASPRLRPQYRQ